MARRKTRTLTEVELEFMQAVWQVPGDEVSTEQVMETLARSGRDLADGSVRKVLSILVRKGYLRRRREGRGFLYRATVARDEAGRSLAQDILRRAFDGSAALMVAAILDTRGVGKGDIEKIKKLIAQREREAKQ